MPKFLSEEVIFAHNFFGMCLDMRETCTFFRFFTTTSLKEKKHVFSKIAKEDFSRLREYKSPLHLSPQSPSPNEEKNEFCWFICSHHNPPPKSWKRTGARDYLHALCWIFQRPLNFFKDLFFWFFLSLRVCFMLISPVFAFHSYFHINYIFRF